MMVIKRNDLKYGLHKASLQYLVAFLLSLSIGGVTLEAKATSEKGYRYEIVVFGGTSGGFTAAIQAAKAGKMVALLEPSMHVGGMNVEGLGGTDIDNHREFQNSPAVGGLALEFYRRIAKAYQREEQFEAMLKEGKKEPALWRFEPHVAEGVIKEWLKEYPIDVFVGAPLKEGKKAVKKKGTQLLSISTEKGVFEAKVFIDATIEGDLLARSGVTTTIGREANAVYGETKNGIREHTTHGQFALKVDPYRITGNSDSGLIPTILDEPLGEPGQGDHRLQAYCFRVCMTKDPENKIPFKKPLNYDRNQYEIYLRYLKAGGKLYTPSAGLPNGKTDFNGGRDLSHNLNGMNYDYPEGSYKTREKILQYHRDFTEGIFYFLANDPEVGRLDPALQETWASWGLAKDEFTDNEGWPRQFYVRDARRMVSDYVITEHHVKRENPVAVPDPVAVAYWPPDVHNVRTIVRDGYAYHEGSVFGGNDWIPFGISYRSLVPKVSECTNLLTSSCPSSSHIAYGAIRIEFTFMALGQACASAAVLAIEQNQAVQQVDYPTLKSRLLEDGQVLSIQKDAYPE